ncbi:MAG: hypothetical protein ACOVP1_10805 [Bacteroidia bacterium]
MKNQIIKINLILVSLISVLSSCKKEEAKNPGSVNSQEQITSVYLKIANLQDSSDYQMVLWKDLDGDGGKAPQIDTLRLKDAAEYQVEVLVLDESKAETDTVSLEIKKEADVHRFFYKPSVTIEPALSINYLDVDSKNRPVGLMMNFKVVGLNLNLPLLGSLNLILSHYDGVEKSNEMSSESDLDIVFPVKITK